MLNIFTINNVPDKKKTKVKNDIKEECYSVTQLLEVFF